MSDTAVVQEEEHIQQPLAESGLSETALASLMIGKIKQGTVHIDPAQVSRRLRGWLGEESNRTSVVANSPLAQTVPKKVDNQRCQPPGRGSHPSSDFRYVTFAELSYGNASAPRRNFFSDGTEPHPWQ